MARTNTATKLDDATLAPVVPTLADIAAEIRAHNETINTVNTSSDAEKIEAFLAEKSEETETSTLSAKVAAVVAPYTNSINTVNATDYTVADCSNTAAAAVVALVRQSGDIRTAKRTLADHGISMRQAVGIPFAKAALLDFDNAVAAAKMVLDASLAALAEAFPDVPNAKGTGFKVDPARRPGEVVAYEAHRVIVALAEGFSGEVQKKAFAGKSALELLASDAVKFSSAVKVTDKWQQSRVVKKEARVSSVTLATAAYLEAHKAIKAEYEDALTFRNCASADEIREADLWIAEWSERKAEADKAAEVAAVRNNAVEQLRSLMVAMTAEEKAAILASLAE